MAFSLCQRYKSVLDEEEQLKYSIGGLLYVPAMNKKLPQKVREKKFPNLTSLAFCLEDTIQDEYLEEAESSLKVTLGELKKLDTALPLIFIRIRTPEHMRHIYESYQDYRDIITGYILPKFDLSNMEEYISLIRKINKSCDKKIYIMPILESRMVADIGTRVGTLSKIKEAIDTVRGYVLNIRVGGNDFCNLYGLRRSVSQSIYDIGVIRDIFVDIINIFASDYVVSGPVWEYFGPERDGKWDAGLVKELELDRLNGFIGKTAIHPTQ
ncbi:MAG: HpcH/HpaI aldolase/citrate lyase family protein, partial [Lachnospiraceae bacterium]|nr:HpcH/HpaI aldolase/citrate lyase family protein [Lachnospiraceae bacterium]